MLTFVTLSFAVWVIGLVMWIFCEPKYPKATAIGHEMFWVGLLAWLLEIGGVHLH